MAAERPQPGAPISVSSFGLASVPPPAARHAWPPSVRSTRPSALVLAVHSTPARRAPAAGSRTRITGAAPGLISSCKTPNRHSPLPHRRVTGRAGYRKALRPLPCRTSQLTAAGHAVLARLGRSYVIFLWRSVSALVTALRKEDLSGYRYRQPAISTEFSQVRSTATESYSNFGLGETEAGVTGEPAG